MVDPELLKRWCSRFFGYGSWDAPYWFIGLEEGGVDSPEEFQTRLDAWHNGGEPSLLDLDLFHKAIGRSEHTEPDAKLQPTWRPLLRALFRLKGLRNFDNDALRAYQIQWLGRVDGETALLELSPLPAAKTTNRWFQRDPGNPMRTIDVDLLKRLRRTGFTQLIDECEPKVVICYGDLRGWSQHFALMPMHSFYAGTRGSTIVVASHPPGRHAPTNAHWDDIGDYIASRL